MELCAGKDLFDKIIVKEHYSEKVVASIFKQIVNLVHVCHFIGEMHMDLKSKNLLLASKNKNALLKTTDFVLCVRSRMNDIAMELSSERRSVRRRPVRGRSSERRIRDLLERASEAERGSEGAGASSDLKPPSDLGSPRLLGASEAERGSDGRSEQRQGGQIYGEAFKDLKKATEILTRRTCRERVDTASFSGAFFPMRSSRKWPSRGSHREDDIKSKDDFLCELPHHHQSSSPSKPCQITWW